MRNTKTLAFAVAAAATFALVGCNVEKTQEGNVDLPKFEKTQEGNVTVPKYDVTAPDVKVTTEEKTVTVPKLDIKTADEKAAEQGKK